MESEGADNVQVGQQLPVGLLRAAQMVAVNGQHYGLIGSQRVSEWGKFAKESHNFAPLLSATQAAVFLFAHIPSIERRVMPITFPQFSRDLLVPAQRPG